MNKSPPRCVARSQMAKPDPLSLPRARHLAAVLGVNTNTVLRAMRTLRDEGLLEFRRGRGATVTGAAPQQTELIAKARELVSLAHRLGYKPDELTRLVSRLAA
jgi:GntR family transcriptional regulator